MTYNTDFEFTECPTFSLTRLAWRQARLMWVQATFFFCSNEANVSWWLTKFSLAGQLTAEVFFYCGNTRGTASEPYLPKPLKTHIPTPSHIQNPFCIVTLPSQLNEGKCQMAGKLPSWEDPTLLQKHSGGVQWCLFKVSPDLTCTLLARVFKTAAMFITEQDQERHLRLVDHCYVHLWIRQSGFSDVEGSVLRSWIHNKHTYCCNEKVN